MKSTRLIDAAVNGINFAFFALMVLLSPIYGLPCEAFRATRRFARSLARRAVARFGAGPLRLLARFIDLDEPEAPGNL